MLKKKPHLWLAALLLTIVASAGPLLAQQGEITNAPHTAETGQPGLLDFDLAGTIWVLVIFLVVVAVLYKAAWKNVLAGLKAREAKIRGDISAAEANRIKAEQALAQYNSQLATAQEQIRTMLASAAADGEKLATSIRMKAQSDAEEIKERATKEIENARDAALREIYATTAELSTSIAEKIIRRNLNAADQQDLVRQSLEQLHSVA